ncbi:hypothetical protein IV203_023055 [Nitzschia inconspicua]|uniref:Uncharacterized protein n=1 Tax=Nitzschia inconspicua TaxID=303405 RepID=A0A9K3KC89_9STRA|nr:hypothetical protein IV203_023055 [Nitzschia inconspicua]
MVRLRGKTLYHITEGTLVTVKMDPRDAKKARGLLGIVYDTSGNRAGGIKVATQHGIITKENKKNEYFILLDRYTVPKIQDVALTPSLKRVRKEIMVGKFDRKTPKKVSMPRAYKLVEARRQCRQEKGLRLQRPEMYPFLRKREGKEEVHFKMQMRRKVLQRQS